MIQERTSQVMSKSSRHTRELARYLGKLTEAQAAVGWAVILMLAALLGAIYLNQTSQIAAVGRQIQQLQIELDTLQEQNAALEREIATSQSLERLQQAAEAQGFIPAQAYDMEYIVVPNYPVNPLEPETSSAPAAPREPVTTMREALELTLASQFDALIRGESHE